MSSTYTVPINLFTEDTSYHSWNVVVNNTTVTTQFPNLYKILFEKILIMESVSNKFQNIVSNSL